jgi:hypothetical protein
MGGPVHAEFIFGPIASSTRRNDAPTNQEEFMKKVLALAAVLGFCAAIGLANAGHGKGHATEATITKLDTAGKSMVVKTADGKEMTIYWNDATKVSGGELKEGETVHFTSTSKDGKTWATSVHVGAMKNPS